MSRITHNGKTYVGNSISIVNNVVYVDGKKVEGDDSKEINITVEGNIESLSVEAMVNTMEVKGDVTNLKTVSGYINCRNVKGDIQET